MLNITRRGPARRPAPDTESRGEGVPPPTREDRYERFDGIPWFRREIVSGATILLVGAGALGNEVLKNLVLFGVGQIVVCDFDRVELSNLSRAPLFTEEDIGQNKAVVAARAARRMNPHVQVVPLALNILGDVGTAFFGAYDVVIGAVDTREGRLAINRACWRMNRPFIDGALGVMSGVVKVFVPPDSPCYECTMSDEDFRLLPQRTSCGLLARETEAQGGVPTTPISAALIGALQVQEALKLLHGQMAARRLRGEAYVFDGLNFEPMMIRFQRKRDEDCSCHDTYEHVRNIPGSRREMLVADLVDQARREHGLDCTYLALDRDILTSLHCEQCEHDEAINRPFALYRGDPGHCPRCGSGNRRAQWRGSVELADLPLETRVVDLGVPPMDVLTLQTDRANLRVTLLGDRDELLPEEFRWDG